MSTAIGAVVIAWKSSKLLAVQLPEATESAAVERLVAKVERAHGELPTPGEPTGAVRSAARAIADQLAGIRAPLGQIALALDALPPFRRRVYEALRATSPGDRLTYAELAARAGSPGAARAVGAAMRSNPFPIVVPCHRVVGAGGKPGGFSAYGGLTTKEALLAIERPREREEHGAPPFDRARAAGELARSDRTLARVIRAVGECALTIRPRTETFAALAEAIVYQQLNGKAAKTIFDRVRAAVGPTLDAESVARVSDERLRAAGLSANKLRALRDLSARDREGQIPARAALDAMSDAEIVEALTKVRGIGPWTVEMLLIFRLGRADVLPVDDYGVRSGFARAYRRTELPSARELAAWGERWRPWRSVAAWYLWRVLDLPEKRSSKRRS